MSARADIRKQVMAHILGAMTEADAAGHDSFAIGRRMFPEVPIEVITEAWLEIENRKVEAWWQSVERTIDGELISRAAEGPAR